MFTTVFYFLEWGMNSGLSILFVDQNAKHGAEPRRQTRGYPDENGL
jgi:hypothetical protein